MNMPIVHMKNAIVESPKTWSASYLRENQLASALLSSCFVSPEMPTLAIVLALLRREIVTAEGPAAMQLDR